MSPIRFGVTQDAHLTTTALYSRIGPPLVVLFWATSTMWSRASAVATPLFYGLFFSTIAFSGTLAFVPQVSDPSTECSGVYTVTMSLQSSWEDGEAMIKKKNG